MRPSIGILRAPWLVQLLLLLPTLAEENVCLGPGGAEKPALFWPRRSTFKYQQPAREIKQGMGNHLITRSALAVLERIFHQNHFRQASRNEVPGFVFTHIEGLDPVLSSLAPETKSSSCPGLAGLASKKVLRTNLDLFERMMGRSHAGFLPQAWNLPQDLHQMTAAHDGYIILRDPHSHFANNVHIVHSSSLDQIHEVLNQGKGKEWMGIKYVMPQLWDKRKWDFRVHVLISGYDPMRVWLGGEELTFARRAMEDFTFEDTSIRVHTTNMRYDGSVDENPFRPFPDARKFFPGGAWEKMMKQVRTIVQRSLLAVEPRVRDRGKMLMLYSDQCWELLGYDFYPAENGDVYLLEVNRNPDPGYVYSQLQGEIKAQTMHDVLCVVGASCAMASKDPIANLTEDERTFLEPFEFSSGNITERLLEDHRRYLKRAARTSFVPVWPPLEEDAEAMAYAKQLQATEEWYPSYFSKLLWPPSAIRPEAMPAKTGYTKGNFVFSP